MSLPLVEGGAFWRIIRQMFGSAMSFWITEKITLK
jgi:hypothetical protein